MKTQYSCRFWTSKQETGDVIETGKIVFGTTADDVENDNSDMEEDVNITDHDQTK